MKTRTRMIFGSLLIAAALATLAACGGGDGDDGVKDIRTQKGLVLASIAEQLGASANESDGTGAAPADQPLIGNAGAQSRSSTDLSFGKGGDIAPFPFLQEGGNGVTVQGYGSATTAADSAIAEFYFYSNAYGDGIEPFPVPETRSSSGSGIAVGEPSPGDFATDLQAVEPITEDDLQPVIDALTGAGIARADIEFIGQGYFDKYSSSATLRATVTNLESLDSAVTAATDAAAGLTDISLSNANVSYTVTDCSALEVEAMKAAVEDANDRVTAFAQALGITAGDVIGASNYSYSPYGGTVCGAGYAGPYPLGGVPFIEGQASEVQVFAQISVTFAIQ